MKHSVEDIGFSFSAHTKFLITGEYLVLHGAKALACPLKFSQKANFFPSNNPIISCKSFDENNNIWFSASYDIPNFKTLSTSDPAISDTFCSLLLEISKENQAIFAHGWEMIFTLDFNRAWGLGTSSTLVSIMAAWAKIDPFLLQFKIFGGSGYDIACASATGPILYQLVQKEPYFVHTKWEISDTENMVCVYLNQKKNSRSSLFSIKDNVPSSVQLEEMNALTETILNAKSSADLIPNFKLHERLISQFTGFIPIQDSLFPDFQGVVKSLGAWGGDFIFAISPLGPEYTKSYFGQKGYTTQFSFDQLIYR
jgi:mevalonate kinase